MRRLKKLLQDNLSLSSKLFLRVLLKRFRKAPSTLAEDLQQQEAARRRHSDRARVVIFDERVPSPDRDAGSLRMFLILKLLAADWHVVFVPFNRPQSIDYERALWKEGIETANAEDYRRLIKDPNAKAAIVVRASMGEVFIGRIRRSNRRLRIIFDTVDIHFHRLQREYEISGDIRVQAESERYRKREAELSRSSDIVWCASPEDKAVLQRETTAARIEVVPTIHELRDSGNSFEDRSDLLFIGSFSHRPNDDAMRFFMREVHPFVQQTLPGVSLDIIGGNPSPDLAAHSSALVRIRGYVAHVEPYLRNARVFVAPLRFGAGIKGKVGEAMAHGIPVVTTSVGAEGFGLTHGLDVMIGDDPESFASAIFELYTNKDLWQRVAENGRLRIEQHFTPVVVARTIAISMKDL